MHFFEQQRRQRSRTALLVFLFALVVISLSAVTGAVVAFFLPAFIGHPIPVSFLKISGVVFAVICLVSLYRILELQRGGEAIAELLGASLVLPSDTDPLRRRLHNIVEEMALAAGITVPHVYVMQGEPAVNAMAAGLDASAAAVIVTQGALELLSRDELQGVVAHEFSHILNGDMRLNVQLTGAIAGLVMISSVGRFLLQSRGASSSRRQGGSGFGLLLLAIGSLGVFCSRILQSAISRGRERLADASAVQFTRHPAGLAGALAKIRDLVSSEVHHPHRDLTSHFFFASVAPSGFFRSLLSTHPPLEERIQALDPSFLTEPVREKLRASLEQNHSTLEILRSAAPEESASLVGQALSSLNAMEVTSQVGTLKARACEHAARVINEIPPRVRTSLGQDELAKVAVLAALAENEKAWREMAPAFPVSVQTSAEEIYEFAKTRPRDQRLNLIMLAVPTLRGLSLREKQTLLEASVRLTEKETSTFAIAARLILKYSLFPLSNLSGGPLGLVNIRPVMNELRQLFTWLAAQQADASGRRSAFRAGMQALTRAEVGEPLENVPSPEVIEKALVRLRGLPPAWKERVIRGLWECVLSDGQVVAEEAEAARAVSVAIGAPMPPLIAL